MCIYCNLVAWMYCKDTNVRCQQCFDLDNGHTYITAHFCIDESEVGSFGRDAETKPSLDNTKVYVHWACSYWHIDMTGHKWHVNKDKLCLDS